MFAHYKVKDTVFLPNLFSGIYNIVICFNIFNHDTVSHLNFNIVIYFLLNQSTSARLINILNREFKSVI